MKTPAWVSRRSLGRMMLGSSLGLLAVRHSADANVAREADFVNGGSVNDHLAIERLVYQYAMALDNLDAPALADCFAANGVLFGAGLNFRGAFAEELIAIHRAADFTMHTVMNHVYSLKEGTATGVTYGIATWVVTRDAERIRIDGYTRYHDELVKEGNRWRFLKRRYEPVFSTEARVKNFTAPEREKKS